MSSSGSAISGSAHDSKELRSGAARHLCVRVIHAMILDIFKNA